MTTQRFDHTCDACRFVGTHGRFDLWFCPRGSLGGACIARYGLDDGAYASTCVSVLLRAEGAHYEGSTSWQALRECYKRSLSAPPLSAPT